MTEKGGVNRSLASLLSGGKDAEKSITGKGETKPVQEPDNALEGAKTGPAESLKADKEQVATEDKKPAERVGEAIEVPVGYSGMFTSNAALKSHRRESAFLYTPVRDALKNLAAAEGSELITLVNNICLAFLKEHKQEVKKSLKKLERSVNELM